MPTKNATKRDTVGDLMKLVDEGVAILESTWLAERSLTYDELVFFQREWILSETEASRLLRRYEGVKSQQQICGTAADREALAKAATDAAERAEQAGPAIRAEIETLQRQLNQLERERDSTAKRCVEAGQAVEQLRSAAPTPIKRMRDGRQNHVSETVRRPLLELETDLRHWKTLMALDPNDPRARETFAFHEATRDCVTKSVDAHRQISYQLNTDAYHAWREEAAVDIKHGTEELERLQAIYDQQVEEVDRLLDFWLR